MSRKASKKVETEVSSSVASSVAQAAPSKKSKKSTVSVPTTVPETSIVPSSAVTDTSSVASVAGSGKRRAPTMESVQTDFTDLMALISTEVAAMRAANKQKGNSGTKFLLSINKLLKRLQGRVQRVSRHRPRVVRNNTNSGFLKPVYLSKELCKFTGWDPAVPRSRVDVTKFICQYIRSHNLQDPNNKKHILVQNDRDLNALLKYDGKSGKPLDYCHIQTCLKNQGHFLTDASATATASASVATASESRAERHERSGKHESASHSGKHKKAHL